MRLLKRSVAVNWIKNFAENNPFAFPLTLFAISLVTYGLFVFSLGFYWDDWPPILVSHIADKNSFWDYYLFDRPFQSWTYYFLFAICRDSAFAWQLAVIIFRWAAGLTLYYSFILVFPRSKLILHWAVVLFVVFPGFANQYVSVVYSTAFLNFTLFGASLLMMLLSIKFKPLFWVLFPVSLIFTLVHLFTMEYFVGLEVLRPVMIFLMIKQVRAKAQNIFKSALLHWLPYLFLLLIYLYWRIIVFPGSMGGAGTDNWPHLFSALINTPKETFFAFFNMVFSDLRYLFITIWTDHLVPVNLPLEKVIFWLSLLIGLVASSAVGYFLLLSKNGEVSQPFKKDYFLLIGVAFLIVFGGLLPIWSSLRQITIGKWADRFSLPAMFGVALFLSVFIFALSQNIKFRTWIIILIVGLSISFQIQSANTYRKDFVRQTNFYQQLKWRVPGLKPGTALYSQNTPAAKEADYSFTMGINLLYSADELDTDFEYWFLTPRYYDPEMLVKNPGLPIEQGLRTFKFVGSASKVVSIFMPDTGCLWVVDPYYPILQNELDFQAKATEIPDYSLYSRINNQDLILEDELEVNNLSGIFDFSPQQTWCYYFEKGDLAQSKGNWNLAVKLYEESVQLGLVPVEGVEYLPFIKAYTALGKIDAAVNLTGLMFKKSFYTKPMMCQFWYDTLNDNAVMSSSSISQVFNSENCPVFFDNEAIQ